MKTFALMRDKDVSGISGTGLVAEGVVFANGKVVIAWCSLETKVASVTIYGSIEEAELVHGHGGATRIVFNEKPAE
jgi:hypothetical protein